MIKRLFQSRGSRKFRKNRFAMMSLVIILGYVLLGAWIAGTNFANWAGQKSGAFTLEGRPFAGLFLTSGTLRVVGPKEIPGFGLEPNTTTRLGAASELLGLARRGLQAAGQLEEGSGRSARQALADVSWPDRPFADLPLDELERRVAEAEAAFARVVDVRRAVQELRSLPIYIERIVERRAALERTLADETADEDAILIAAEELAFGLEDFVAAVQKYSAVGEVVGEDDPIASLDLAEIEDASINLLDADPSDREAVRGAMFEGTIVDEVRAAQAAALARSDTAVGSILNEVEPMIGAVFPRPEGARGLLYGFKLFAGTDTQGRSILVRALYSSYVAIQVGLVTALFAVIFGGVFGAAAAFIGGPLDHVFNWIYSMITSIPYLVLLAVLSFLFLGSAVEGTLVPLYVAFGVTYWVGPGRVIRGESMKIKELEYVQATTAMGFGRMYILLKHVIPNTSHLLFINFSLLFIAAIKGEVILTFLGLGLKDGASWGIMIDQSKSQVVNDFFWQIGTATFFMFLLVLAFNIFTDALQDAFDPKHVS